MERITKFDMLQFEANKEQRNDTLNKKQNHNLPAYRIINGTWQRGAIIHPGSRTVTLYEKDSNGQMQPFGTGVY